MIVQLLMLTQLIACEDTQEQAPPPPPKAVEQKKEEKKEIKKEVSKVEKPAGTQPKVTTKTKLMATPEVSAAQSKMLLGMIKRTLNGQAKTQGFDGVRDVKIAKQSCTDGKCKGVGQGTAYKTVITYEVGNSVAVSQEDKSKKNATIKEIKEGKYIVTYDDGSEATVEKSALSIQKPTK